jgi:hypothetical protein
MLFRSQDFGISWFGNASFEVCRSFIYRTVIPLTGRRECTNRDRCFVRAFTVSDHASKKKGDMKSLLTTILLATTVGLGLTATRASATPESTPAVMQTTAKASSARLIVMAGVTGAQSGFTVDWVAKSVYDALGDFPPATDANFHTGNFVGVPVWVVQGTSGDFTLPPTAWQAVELGELFDESGVKTTATDELSASTDYVIRIKANGGVTYSESAPSAPLVVSTSAQQQNCTFTQGYWKNHTSVWPSGPITLGTVSYTPAQLLSIFNKPAGGNGLIILAHQLIAAKLNIMNGADASSIASTIASADALIGGLICPPVGSGFLTPASVNSLATNLDNYNNGLVGPGHCGTTAAAASTWGSIKSLYRK